MLEKIKKVAKIIFENKRLLGNFLWKLSVVILLVRLTSAIEGVDNSLWKISQAIEGLDNSSGLDDINRTLKDLRRYGQ